MLLKQTVAAACLLALGTNAMSPGQIAKAEQKAAFDAKRAAAKAAIEQAKADFDSKRRNAKAIKHEQIEARQAEVDAKQAERDAKHAEWWARVSKIIQSQKEKANYAKAKELQRQQKANFALQKELDLAAKREAHKNRQQQQEDRLLLKELRKVQKEAWKALNAQQKANYEALDKDQKANWEKNRADEIAQFNKNIEDWETEDQRQKATWDHIMAHQQLHWAAKVSGLYQGGSQCSMPGNDFNPLYEAEDFDHGIDFSSYDEADVQVGAVSFARSQSGGFYLLVSTDKHNALYEIFTKEIAGQEATNTKSGYSEHSKARNFQAINDVDALAAVNDAYNVKMVAIANVDGSQFNWAICYNVPEDQESSSEA